MVFSNPFEVRALLEQAEAKLNGFCGPVTPRMVSELAFWRKLWLNELLHMQLREFNHNDGDHNAEQRQVS